MGVVNLVTAEGFSPSLGVRADDFGNPIGKALPGWTGCARLPDSAMHGRTCQVVAYEVRHAASLFDAFARDDGRMFSYLPWGPFASAAALDEVVQDYIQNRDFQTFVIMRDEVAMGLASYMRYDPGNGSVEIGGLTFSPGLQKTTATTEAMYLMMRRAFEGGYRRYEWKCDQLNAPSMRAAQRLGFTFEGVFRNAVVSKGRRRDTAWYSVIVEDWPTVRDRLEAWLTPDNFDAAGRQKTALGGGG